MVRQHRVQVVVLGAGGLVPFVGLATLVLMDGEAPWATWLAGYAFGIVVFLLGSWWGLALARQDRQLGGLSILIFLLALGWFLMLRAGTWLLAAAGLLFVLFVLERWQTTLRRAPRYYVLLRAWLSAVASVCLLGVVGLGKVS